MWDSISCLKTYITILLCSWNHDGKACWRFLHINGHLALTTIVDCLISFREKRTSVFRLLSNLFSVSGKQTEFAVFRCFRLFSEGTQEINKSGKRQAGNFPERIFVLYLAMQAGV
jgi:hypothetical protein